MADQPMMKCGHAANATTTRDGETIPCCVICVMVPGLGDDATTVDAAPPDLSERTARCGYYGSVPSGRSHESNYGCKRGERCMCEQPSMPGLPFFEHRPDDEHDRFYCGCWGWD